MRMKRLWWKKRKSRPTEMRPVHRYERALPVSGRALLHQGCVMFSPVQPPPRALTRETASWPWPPDARRIPSRRSGWMPGPSGHPDSRPCPRVQIAGKPQGLSLMVPGRTQAVLPEGPETPAGRPARTAKPPCCLGPLRTGLDERMLYSGRLPARSLIQRMV